VYDVTSFVPEHPGGAPIMLPYCGKDATAAFDTKGAVNKMHSINAEKMLSKYLVGSLVI
jgi:cytochrome b involved in lipid metabolism